MNRDDLNHVLDSIEARFGAGVYADEDWERALWIHPQALVLAAIEELSIEGILVVTPELVAERTKCLAQPAPPPKEWTERDRQNALRKTQDLLAQLRKHA